MLGRGMCEGHNEQSTQTPPQSQASSRYNHQSLSSDHIMKGYYIPRKETVLFSTRKRFVNIRAEQRIPPIFVQLGLFMAILLGFITSWAKNLRYFRPARALISWRIICPISDRGPNRAVIPKRKETNQSYWLFSLIKITQGWFWWVSEFLPGYPGNIVLVNFKRNIFTRTA